MAGWVDFLIHSCQFKYWQDLTSDAEFPHFPWRLLEGYNFLLRLDNRKIKVYVSLDFSEKPGSEDYKILCPWMR